MVKYSPKDAEISEATLSVVRNGNVVGTTSNIMGGVTASKGMINFKDLEVPTLSSVTPSNDRISLSFGVLGKSLLSGKYSENTDILDLPFTPPPPPLDMSDAPVPRAPAVGDWSTKPAVVNVAPGHVNHWHIALKG